MDSPVNTLRVWLEDSASMLFDPLLVDFHTLGIQWICLEHLFIGLGRGAGMFGVCLGVSGGI